MRYFSLVFLLLHGFAQAQLPVLNLDNDTLFLLNADKLSDPSGNILFSTKGNIIFQGNSTAYNDIRFTLAIDSLAQKKQGTIYDKKGAASDFFIQESTVNIRVQEQMYRISTFVRNADNWAIYSNLNDSLLAFIPTTIVSNAQLFAVFYALWERQQMQKQLDDFIHQSAAKERDGLAAMVPVLGNAWIWVWDGTYLYPNGVPMSSSMVWKFENNKLSPVHYPRTQEEWRWDGQGLKPYWGGNPQNQWEWRNGVLRQIWNNNFQNEYIIDENQVIRKRFGIYGDNEWQIEGDMPLPLITAVVLGIVFR